MLESNGQPVAAHSGCQRLGEGEEPGSIWIRWQLVKAEGRLAIEEAHKGWLAQERRDSAWQPEL